VEGEVGAMKGNFLEAEVLKVYAIRFPEEDRDRIVGKVMKLEDGRTIFYRGYSNERAFHRKEESWSMDAAVAELADKEFKIDELHFDPYPEDSGVLIVHAVPWEHFKARCDLNDYGERTQFYLEFTNWFEIRRNYHLPRKKEYEVVA
jgi:hypothetical protein